MMSAPPPPMHQPIPAGADMMPQQVHAGSQNLLYSVHPTHPHHDVDQQKENGVIISGSNEEEPYLNHENLPKDNDAAGQERSSEETSQAGSTEEVNSDYSGEPVKLFVGQVPRSMDEADLFPVFEKFGPMEDVAIIRDKHTGQHRGCAFVTFFTKESADVCEAELHNKYMFEGGKRAVQIRPAGRKEEVENKVFVGMLPRDIAEETVRDLFSPYGEIKGIFLIRSSDGIKKGCAFVKYTERSAAMAAIHSLNNTIALEGSDRPLIVKIADTKTQKKQRHIHHVPMYPHDAPISTHSPPGSYNGNMYYIPQGQSVMHPHLYPGAMPAHVPGHVTPNVVSSNASSAGSYSSGQPGHGQYPQYLHQHRSTHGTAPGAPPSYVYPQLHYDAGSHYAEQVRMPPQQSNQRPREGPAGANLFIYHLPHDLTDADLATAFNPFGNVISAKVYVDRFTGESKGFGFVSYDSIISAEHAIEQMNGFQIGNKRLKVQHKRVNHRPPVSVPAMHHHYYPQMQGPMHQIPVHDVPPAIEISGPSIGVDNAYSSSHFAHNGFLQPQMQHPDMDGLTTRFEALQTDQANGDEHPHN